MKQMLYLIVFLLYFTTCQKSNDAPTNAEQPLDKAILVFNSGFEGSTQVSSNATGQYDQITGIDTRVSAPNDWVNDLQNKNGFGRWRFYYEQGSPSQRYAKIVEDPLNPANKALNFTILEPHITLSSGEVKARVQVEQYGGTGVKEFYQSVRLFLPKDFDQFSNGTVPGKGDWITLFEYWNNAVWPSNATYPFRISVNLDKVTPDPSSPIRFEIHGQVNEAGKFKTIWGGTKESFNVPTGKWMTIEIYFKEGKGSDGKFYLAATPDGGSKTVVFNVSSPTCHPDDPAPDGLTEINPLKLYTSANVVNYMNAKGGKLQVFWDDYKIWLNKKPVF